MKKNNPRSFWDDLERPFFVLAPMADVTDVVFREFIACHARPDVFFTEFVSARGLRSSEGRAHLIRDLQYTENQRPIVAQVFGGDPRDFEAVAQLLADLGFDGIDINMGCPVKKVGKQGAGADLIKDPDRARAIIRAAKRGAGSLPVSVKTRIGYNTIITEEWISALCQADPAAITVHARTQKEMSEVPAHWDEVKKAVNIAHEHGIVLIGNGDVKSREEGERLAEESGVDGIMIGRGVYGNPWVFGRAEREMLNTKRKTGDAFPARRSVFNVQRSISHLECDRMRALAELIVMYDGFWGDEKNFEVLKRFFKSYIHGFDGAKDVRNRMMDADCSETALDILSHAIRECNSAWEMPEYKRIQTHVASRR